MKNTTMWKEGAILLGIYVLMLLIAIFVPVLNFLIQFLLIFPFLLFSSKHSVKASALFLISAIIITFPFGTFAALVLTMIFGITGLVMGYAIQTGKTKVITYIASSITLLLTLLVAFIFAIVFLKVNIFDELNELYRNSIQQYFDALRMLGQEPPTELQEQMYEMLNVMNAMAPTMLLMSSFVVVIILMAIHFPIIKRFGVRVPKFPPFRKLTFPKSVLWYYLIALVFSMIVQLEVGSYWYMALINGAYILQTFLVLQGLSFIFHFCHQKKWTKAIPIIAVILTIILPPVLSIVRVLGIIDIGFNLRERLGKK